MFQSLQFNKILPKCTRNLLTDLLNNSVNWVLASGLRTAYVSSRIALPCRALAILGLRWNILFLYILCSRRINESFHTTRKLLGQHTMGLEAHEFCRKRNRRLKKLDVQMAFFVTSGEIGLSFVKEQNNLKSKYR